jgi:lipopolysaccharide/colanic/teichoic acid biosynthesis glycosyltransferase
MNLNMELPKDMEAYLKKLKKYFFVKRVVDAIFSIVALTILLPLFLATAVAIKIDSKGKVIFSQLRTGKNGKSFIMYKFRSMYEGAEAKRNDLIDQNEMDGPVFKISNDPRITKVGKFIRSYSIDELPQLVNIIRGEMSIVGPRPLAVYETEKFVYDENLRHLVKPGLTCYWQIGGRNELSFREWIDLDMKYITEMSVKTDFKLILLTFKVVILKKGAY